MMGATKELLDREIHRQREQAQRAIERGGLPTEAEIVAAEAASGRLDTGRRGQQRRS